MHLEIQRPLNCALGIIRRRELKLMQAPGTLKLALLKSNANRVRALAFGIDRGWNYAYGLFTWHQSVMHTATALLVWVTFWCVCPFMGKSITDKKGLATDPAGGALGRTCSRGTCHCCALPPSPVSGLRNSAPIKVRQSRYRLTANARA